MTHARHQTKFRWTEGLTCRFIQLRKENGKLFTGRKYSAQAGWEYILQQMQQEFPTIMADVHYRVLKKKWSNLLQQYKELRNPVHGDRNKADDVSWPFYGAIDEVLDYGRRTSTNTDEYIDPHEFLCVSVTPEEPPSPPIEALPAGSKEEVEYRRASSSSMTTQRTRVNSDECSIGIGDSHIHGVSNRQAAGDRMRKKGTCKDGPISRLSSNAELSIERIATPRSACDPRDDPPKSQRIVEEADSARNRNRVEGRPRKLRRNRVPCHEDHEARVDRRLEQFFEYVRRRDEENRSIMMRILHAVESIANKL